MFLFASLLLKVFVGRGKKSKTVSEYDENIGIIIDPLSLPSVMASTDNCTSERYKCPPVLSYW